MQLKRLTKRIWYYPYEEARDRPNLGYIRGDKWSLAVDAGHSDAHVEEFYEALERENLPLPALTVLTHWHWDHSFGLHRINGLSVANRLTNQHLRDFREKVAEKGSDVFLSLHESVRLEYAGGKEIRVDTADMEFENELLLDAGNCPIRLFQAESPHTDDSTLVHVPGEGVLFLGDAAGGKFPTWEKDPALVRKIAQTVKNTGAKICLEGHWKDVTMNEMMEDFESDMG